jgi:hypothetical protein
MPKLVALHLFRFFMYRPSAIDLFPTVRIFFENNGRRTYSRTLSLPSLESSQPRTSIGRFLYIATYNQLQGLFDLSLRAANLSLYYGRVLRLILGFVLGFCD